MRSLKKALNEKNENFASVSANEIGMTVFVVGLEDGLIRYANSHAYSDLDMPAGMAIDKYYRDCFSVSLVQVYEKLLRTSSDGKEHTAVYYLEKKATWKQASLRRIEWDNMPCALLTLPDINEFVLSQYMSENAMNFDFLLKIPNGIKLEADVSALVNVDAVDLIYFIIKSLHEIHNVYGWDIGDNLLIQIRDWLLESGEDEPEQIYRLEDGFAVLGRGVSKEDGDRRAKSILDRFEEPWVLKISGKELQVYCPIKLGIVRGKYIKDNMRNLLLRTIDSAIPFGHRYITYDEDADKNARYLLWIRDTLINSVHSGMLGFEVNYQPIVDVKTRHWVALEALCRWTTPNGEHVSPYTFIHIAEQLKLVGEIDAWVRETAMRQCVSLGLDKREFLLNINFSPLTRISKSSVKELCKIIKKTGFPIDKLNVEITESSRLSLDEETLQNLKLIAKQGIKLSLDDFGTGYSSLEYLMHLSTHYLKIEKVFLDNIVKSNYKQYLLKMLTNLTTYLNMHIIAEGIETEGQFRILEKLGVGYAQGYLFGEPIPYSQLMRNLDHFTTAQ